MEFDVIIIGGSFAGISAALPLARARRKVFVVDAAEPRNRFAEASHGFFGHDGAEPMALMEGARDQLLGYPTVVYRGGRASSVRGDDRSGFEVSLDSGEAVRGRKVIIAYGIRDELPVLPGLSERWGRSVVHCPYCHGYEFGQAPLGVLGVSPHSVHQAELARDWGPVTYFLNGQPEPDSDQAAFLQKRGVVIERCPVEELVGEAPLLQGVRLKDGRVVGVAGLFVAPRILQNPIAAALGCAFDESPAGPLIRVDEFKMTTVPGVYAAGDAARMMQSAPLASADGLLAGVGAHRALIFG